MMIKKNAIFFILLLYKIQWSIKAYKTVFLYHMVFKAITVNNFLLC